MFIRRFTPLSRFYIGPAFSNEFFQDFSRARARASYYYIYCARYNVEIALKIKHESQQSMNNVLA